jgi:hypothetical protein
MCQCVEKVDKLFKERGVQARVSATLPLESGVKSQVIVALEKTGRGKIPVLTASFCPFCGEKY